MISYLNELIRFIDDQMTALSAVNREIVLNVLAIALIALMSLSSLGCAVRQEAPPLSFSTDYTYLDATGAPNGKRAYLIHGSLNYSRVQWQHPLFAPFVAGLRAQGFSVVLFDLPAFYREYLDDQGLAYRKGFETQFRTIEGLVSQAEGAPTENIVGGFSFGGLHSMMAQVLAPDLFSAYFAILPVVDMTVLEELQGLNASAFNPALEPTLSGHKGLITWGTHDERVNFRLSSKLVMDMNSPLVSAIEYVGLGHTTTPLLINDTLNWTSSL